MTTPSAYPPSILKALAQVRAAVASVPKSGHNSFHHYDYASESDVLSAYNPAMNAAGLIVLPAVLESHERQIETKNGGQTTITRVVMEFTLAHKDGDVWPTPLRWEAQGEDSQDKGLAKAVTSATKYFLTSLFQAEKGTDPDADGGETTRKAPKADTVPRSAAAPTATAAKCPKCGKEGTIIKGKAEFGGGYVCFTKKRGCGAKFATWPPAVESPAPPAPAVSGHGNAAEAVAQGTLPAEGHVELESPAYLKLMVEINEAGNKGALELAACWKEIQPRLKELIEEEQDKLIVFKNEWRTFYEQQGA